MYSNPKCVVRDTDANIVTVINVRSKVIEKSCIDHYGETSCIISGLPSIAIIRQMLL
jgi:hypothetical protein